MITGGFGFVGGGNLDPSVEDARLGLAAREGLGPLGQVFGGWDPALWPLPVLAGQLWAWGEGGSPSTAAIRWPAAIAAALIGLVLSRRMGQLLGRPAAIATAICLFGSIAFVHRSVGAGIDVIQGLCVVGALDRILSRRADWVAGLWSAAALLAGGWPPLLMIALPLVVLRRPGAILNHRLLLPPLAAFAAWSTWAISAASTEAWAGAIALPLTKPMASWLVPSVLALGLPAIPLGLIALLPSIRSTWTEQARFVLVGWLQVAGVALLAGTFVPGLATPARLLGIVSLLVVASAVAERAWSGHLPGISRRLVEIVVLLVVLAWAVVSIGVGGYVAAAVSYYRPIGLTLAIVGYLAALAAACSVWRSRSRSLLGALFVVAISIKVAHWGVYVPEWNYRVGQGPWGRAISHWVPPNRPIYTFTPWPHHLMFHTERPVRLLASERTLNHKHLSTPQYVLLREGEFDHWPDTAPELVKIREFRDERDAVRVLARTAGDEGFRPHAPSWD